MLKAFAAQSSFSRSAAGDAAAAAASDRNRKAVAPRLSAASCRRLRAAKRTSPGQASTMPSGMLRRACSQAHSDSPRPPPRISSRRSRHRP